MNNYKVHRPDGYVDNDEDSDVLASSIHITANGDLVFMRGPELHLAIASGYWDSVELMA